MSELKLAIKDNQTNFAPGETIGGAAGWKLDGPAEQAELRLFWRTEGKGSEDIHIVETVRFDHPGQEEARPFGITAPSSPYSFSGRLISLIWALELVLKPGSHSQRIDLVISPSRQEVRLGSVPDEK